MDIREASEGQEATRIGPYRIVRRLGQGGMGAVYEAVHELIGRKVAIKVLHPQYAADAELTERFFNEARVVNLVDHPGLVQVSDYGRHSDGTSYIVMEFLRGETLGQRLRRQGKALPTPDVVLLAWQIADSLLAAHEKGIVHRDLKPDNIMLVPDPHMPGGQRTKLLDFGIAKLANNPRPHSGPTLQGTVLGTPAFMAPEQCVGEAKLDGKADVYSLGCMMYLMLSGQPPFAGNEEDVLRMQCSLEPLPLSLLAPGVAHDVVALTAWMLKKVAAERPAMRDVVAHLASAVDSESRLGDAFRHSTPTVIVAEPDPQPERRRASGSPNGECIPTTVRGPARNRQATRWTWAGWAVALVLMCVLGVSSFHRTDRWQMLLETAAPNRSVLPQGKELGVPLPEFPIVRQATTVAASTQPNPPDTVSWAESTEQERVVEATRAEELRKKEAKTKAKAARKELLQRKHQQAVDDVERLIASGSEELCRKKDELFVLLKNDIDQQLRFAALAVCACQSKNEEDRSVAQNYYDKSENNQYKKNIAKACRNSNNFLIEDYLKKANSALTENKKQAACTILSMESPPLSPMHSLIAKAAKCKSTQKHSLQLTRASRTPVL